MPLTIKRTVYKKVTATVPKSPPISGCMYKFKSGKNSGAYCGKRCKTGNYCNLHPDGKTKNNSAEKKKKLERENKLLCLMSSNFYDIDTHVYKNKYNEYEEPDTGMIFNPETNEVVRRRNPNRPHSSRLLEDDVYLCISEGWSYYLPDENEEGTETDSEC